MRLNIQLNNINNCNAANLYSRDSLNREAISAAGWIKLGVFGLHDNANNNNSNNNNHNN